MFEVIKDRIKLSIPVMAFVGFTFMIGAVFQWVSFLKKPVDLYSVDYANLRWHDHITADMDFVFSTGLSDGEGGAKRNFYLIPMIEEDGEGGAYMTKVLFYEELAIDSSRTDNIAENVEKLWRGESGALKLGLYSKPFDGFLRKMNKKEKPVFRLYLKVWQDQQKPLFTPIVNAYFVLKCHNHFLGLEPEDEEVYQYLEQKLMEEQLPRCGSYSRRSKREKRKR